MDDLILVMALDVTRADAADGVVLSCPSLGVSAVGADEAEARRKLGEEAKDTVRLALGVRRVEVYAPPPDPPPAPPSSDP